MYSVEVLGRLNFLSVKQGALNFGETSHHLRRMAQNTVVGL